MLHTFWGKGLGSINLVRVKFLVGSRICRSGKWNMKKSSAPAGPGEGGQAPEKGARGLGSKVENCVQVTEILKLFDVGGLVFRPS